MLLFFFLLAFPAQSSTTQPAPGATVPTMSAAMQLADDGRNAEALAVFQQIAAENPGDHAARIWIARMHDRMGHPDRAEAVYRSVVLEDGSNVEALLGVGVTLLERDATSAAIDILERAEQLAPQNPNVLAALGEAHERVGNTERSIGYLQRAVTISPTQTHRLALEQVQREHGHRLESQTYGEQFSGNTSDTRGSDLSINLRLSETLRVAARGQLQTKFGRKENREGGGVQWRWRPTTSFTGQVLIGSRNRILPQADYLGQVDHTYHRTTWTAAGRYFDFFGARVVMFSPAVTATPFDTWTFDLRYAMTTTDTASSTTGRGHSIQIRAAHEIVPRVWAHAAYAGGVENFDNFSIDRIGAFRANTGSAGAQVVLPTLTSIVGTYEFQKRHNGASMNRVNIFLVQTF